MSDSVPPLRVLFESLVCLERAEDREAFLDYTCHGDPSLRARLERLQALRHEAQDFFDIETAPSCERPREEPETDASTTEGVGSKIGRYRLLERLGEGGCGAVYLAEQLEPVKRRVALKIIRLGMDTENVIARFELERQALAMMDHPNIARVFDVGATRTGRPFFVMQLVDGEKITDYCDEHALPVAERLRMFIRICHAIQHAHQKGVIHRDIKPSNILVWVHDGEAVPKVIDFGIAKATGGGGDENGTFTAAGQFVGTPAYMSPEQASGRGMDVDTRSDIFSLGVLLYELLAGRPPFDPAGLREAGVDEVRHILREVEPALPSAAVGSSDQAGLAEVAARRGCAPQRYAAVLRGDLDRIVMKAMAKDRQHRYGTADALAADLARFLNNEPVSARPPSRVYQLRKLVRRNRVVFTSAALVLLTLVLGLGGTTWMFLRANRAREAAELARANEAELRKKAETGRKIAHAAVLLKYDRIEEADAMLSGVPPAEARPSLETAQTFGTLGYWHATSGRWKEAGERYAALAFSLSGVDESDSDKVSLNLLPAAACLCEADEREVYDTLRHMAVGRFGGTTNALVAEQITKACLILPADDELLAKIDPFERLMLAAHEDAMPDHPTLRNLAGWRALAVALLEFRKGNFQKSHEWVTIAERFSNQNGARDVMVASLLAMIRIHWGQFGAARGDLEAARAVVDEWFGPPCRIFKQGEPHWPDWLIARTLLEEAEEHLRRRGKP